MSLRKLGKDSFKVNGVELGYRIGYSYPKTDGEVLLPYYPVASNPYDVCTRYKTMLNKLVK